MHTSHEVFQKIRTSYYCKIPSSTGIFNLLQRMMSTVEPDAIPVFCPNKKFEMISRLTIYFLFAEATRKFLKFKFTRIKYIVNLDFLKVFLDI